MCVRTSSLLRRFSTHISLHPTFRVWKKVSPKERLLEFSEQTLLKNIYEEKIKAFKSHLLERGYPEELIQTTLLEVKFEERKSVLQPKQKENKRILPFVTIDQPSVPNPKQILMKKWHLIEKQPSLSEICRNPPLISYKRGRSLKDILVRAKLWKRLQHALGSRAGLSTQFTR